MHEQNMVGPCNGEGAKPTAVLNTFIGKMDIAVSMDFQKEQFVEVHRQGIYSKNATSVSTFVCLPKTFG